MHKGSRFLVALAIAAITFSGLWFGLGADHFNRGHKMCRPPHGCPMMEHQRPCCDQPQEINAAKVIIVKEVASTDSIKK